MALVKTVEMRVIANAGDAQRKLDELTAQAKALEAERISMRFRVAGGTEGKAQLDAIRAQAERLGLTNISIRMKVNGAGEAIATLTAVRRDAAKGATMIVRIRRIFTGDGGGGDGGGGAGGGGLLGLIGGGASALPLVGGVAGAGGGAGLAVIAAGIAALLPMVAALTSGFAAAGAGLGAFGIIAKSVFTATATAAQQVQAAQIAYDSSITAAKAAYAEAMAAATTSKQRTVAATRLATASQAAENAQVKATAAAYAQLSPPQIALSQAIGRASQAWQSFVAANTGGVAKILTQGIGLLPGIFAALQPFLGPTEHALGGLLGALGKIIAPVKVLKDILPGGKVLGITVTGGTGFRDFIGALSKISGPAITAIGDGIGKVAAQAGKLLTTMSGKDVAHAINIAFGAIAGIIGGVALAVKYLMNQWDASSARIKHDARDVGQALHDVAAAFDTVRHWTAANFGHQIAHDFDTVRHAAAAMADFVAAVPHRVVAAFQGLGGLLVGIGAAWLHGFLGGLRGAWGAVSGWLGGIGGKIKGFFSGAGSWLLAAGTALIGGFGHAVSAGWAAVAGWLSGVKGRITGFFAGAGGWLLAAGQAIIQGLINGITSMIGKVTGVISHIAGLIRSFLPFSPAKQGPLSGPGSPEIAGMRIAEMLARGMDSGRLGVAQAAWQLAGAAGIAPGGGHGRGYSRGDIHYHVNINGLVADPSAAARQVIQLINEYHRHGGGR